jgi:histone H3/H4
MEKNRTSPPHRFVFNFASFHRLVREITQDLNKDKIFQSAAMIELQMAGEKYVTDLFHVANLCALDAKRDYILPKDIQVSCSLMLVVLFL